MKLKDLRFGNVVEVNGKIDDNGYLLFYPHSKHWQEIRYTPWLVKQLCARPGNNEETDFSVMLRGIPLTSEELENLGFECTQESDGFQGGSGWIYVKKIKVNPPFSESIEVYSSEGMIFYKGLFSVQIKYIHQLQNIFFALTGSDLTLKENVEK